MKANKPNYVGPCICGAGPYHKRKCPCHKVYLELKNKAYDQGPPIDLAKQVAKNLFDAGFRQSSRKYRRLMGPKGIDQQIELDLVTFTEFRKLTPTPNWIKKLYRLPRKKY